jgi:hypothetical protein
MVPEDLRAIMVCVDFADILGVTLPRNRHHFKEAWVVTAPDDPVTMMYDWGGKDGLHCLVTDLFYQDGAIFNKWRALEWALDRMGRTGWICNMDCDVVWPKEISWPEHFCPGMLLSPLRRMCPVEFARPDVLDDPKLWQQFGIHRNVAEWAGYSQIFHTSDPRLGPPPWHEIDWTHAGGADSFFQRKWPPALKLRPSWECLHIGPAGENWMGRTTQRLDGSVPEGREGKLRQVAQIWSERHQRRQQGQDQFQPERIVLGRGEGEKRTIEESRSGGVSS